MMSNILKAILEILLGSRGIKLLVLHVERRNMSHCIVNEDPGKDLSSSGVERSELGANIYRPQIDSVAQSSSLFCGQGSDCCGTLSAVKGGSEWPTSKGFINQFYSSTLMDCGAFVII